MSIAPYEYIEADKAEAIAALSATSLAQIVKQQPKDWSENRRHALLCLVKYFVGQPAELLVLRTRPMLKVAWLSSEEINVVENHVSAWKQLDDELDKAYQLSNQSRQNMAPGHPSA